MAEGGQKLGINDLIAELRSKSGLTQNALAQEAGMAPTNINRIERGKQGPPRPTTILRIHYALSRHLPPQDTDRLLELVPFALTKEVPTVPINDQDLLPLIIALKQDFLRGLSSIVAMEEYLRRKQS